VLVLMTACRIYGERIDMACGFIELTDRGLQCEFNNIFTTQFSEVIVTEVNKSIDAISFRQSELFSVPADIFRNFPRLKHLDVELTQLMKLRPEDFRGADDLKYFMARFNDLESVGPRTFALGSSLKYIVLQYNEIASIDPQAFDGLNHLEALYLDYNKMSTVPAHMLDNLPTLMHFSMAYNEMRNLPDDLFMTNERLETLNLGHNLLTMFNDKQFDALPNLEKVQLDHNNITALDLSGCKSTEINVDKNGLKELELNKWTRFVSAHGNPIERFVLHEHYGTGRSYNFSFDAVNEITFFVNEHCCTVENLENFYVLINSFGDLSEKRFDVNDWSCKFLKTIGYETPSGLVVNNVCKRQSGSQKLFTNAQFPTLSESMSATTAAAIGAPSTFKPRGHIANAEDYIASDESTTQKTRESMEDTSRVNIFTGMNIETLAEKRTSTVNPDLLGNTASIEEFYPSTTESYEKKCEKGIWRTVKKKVSSWKNTAVGKWNDWVG